MENNEGYDGRQKRDEIYSIMSTDVLMRETQYQVYIIMWSIDYHFGT